MVVLPITTPTLLSQVHIPTLTQSPRNSQTLYAPTTISASVKSLLSFKDLMVDRKRIAIGQVLKEGESGEGCGGVGGEGGSAGSYGCGGGSVRVVGGEGGSVGAVGGENGSVGSYGWRGWELWIE